MILKLFNLIRDKFYEFKYRKLVYKPTRVRFEGYYFNERLLLF